MTEIEPAARDRVMVSVAEIVAARRELVRVSVAEIEAAGRIRVVVAETETTARLCDGVAVDNIGDGLTDKING